MKRITRIEKGYEYYKDLKSKLDAKSICVKLFL